MCDIINSYSFMFLDADKLNMLKLEAIGLETRTKNYYFDNKNRMDNSYLFQYTLNGCGEIFINNNSHTLKKGDAFFIKCPSNSSYGLNKNNDTWTFLWIILSGNVVENIFNNITNSNCNIINLNECSSAISILKHIHSQAKNGKINNIYYSQELAFSFILRLLETLDKPQEELSLLVTKAKSIIKEHHTSLLGVGDIACRLGVSQEHLSRVFKKETNSRLIDELNKAKLNYAIQLLKERELTIEKIAIKSGFSCGNYFSKVFKRYIGINPKTFKNNPIYSKNSSITIFD